MRISRFVACCILFFVGHPLRAQALDHGKFERLFNIISSPKIFNLSFNKFVAKLDPFCSLSTLPAKQQYKSGNITCVSVLKIDSFTVSGGENIGFVNASFDAGDRCQYIKKILVHNFGQPTKKSGECTMDWNLKAARNGGAQRKVGMEFSKSDNKIYFSIAEDQGP